MATKGQLRNATRWVQHVQKEKSIHKFDLMDKLSMSIATYNQLKPYIEHRFGHLVDYDRKSGVWSAKIVTEVTEASQVMQE